MKCINKNLSEKFFCSLARKIGLILIALMVISFSSCGEDENEKQIAYNQSYDQLFSLRMDINVLSKSLGVKSEDIIQMRYGLIPVNSKLTEVFSNLYNAFNSFDSEKVDEILEEDYNFEISNQKIRIPINELKKQYRANVFARNQKFDSDVPEFVSKGLTHDIEEYLDKEFAWYRFPVNAWYYVKDGKAILFNKYNAGFSEILSTNKINKNIVSRFNDYSSLLEAEQIVLFGNTLTLPKLEKVELEDVNKIANTSIMNKFVERASTDLTDTILLLIEEVGIAIIIWLIFRWLTNRVTKLYARNVLGYDFDNFGFWGNAFILGANLLNAWAENEEKRHLARIRTWVHSIVTVIFAVVTYLYVIKPQIIIEQDIMSQVEINITDYVSQMDVPILDYFNQIIDSIE